ncbi:YjjW family glycine radical enzyme activase [Peptoniphilus sp. GNH]|nr:radical SAM domain protein [Clostridiales bacterium KA00134]UHR02825.1 YjjW family glycine radical enzyme activase [Peptoniphilus sp. GNH]
MLKGIVNKIIPSSLVDGPGNRCAIFFQGCNLNCMYCHNPETINFCKNCGICLEVCPVSALSRSDGLMAWDEKKCINCDACIKACPYGSSPKTKSYEPEELKEVVASYMPFISGVTTSGGECSIQYQFLADFYEHVKALGLSVLCDTNGYIPFRGDRFKKLIDNCDGFMLDVKAFDEKDHIELTGKSNKTIIENAIYLASIGKLDELRTVLLDGHDNFKIVNEITSLLAPYSEHKKIRYKLISYRPFGVREEFLNLKSVSEKEKEELKKIAEKNGNYEVILI